MLKTLKPGKQYLRYKRSEKIHPTGDATIILIYSSISDTNEDIDTNEKIDFTTTVKISRSVQTKYQINDDTTLNKISLALIIREIKENNKLPQNLKITTYDIDTLDFEFELHQPIELYIDRKIGFLI